MNESEPRAEINVRTPRYFILRARGVCRHCNEPADLFGLAVPPGHETLDLDEAGEDPCARDAWVVADEPALIFHIEYLNAEAAARLASLTSSFRVNPQKSFDGPAWTNHCQACGSSFDDDELFCEPGEPFFPIGDASATAVALLCVDEPLEALAGGYSFGAQFVDALSRE